MPNRGRSVLTGDADIFDSKLDGREPGEYIGADESYLVGEGIVNHEFVGRDGKTILCMSVIDGQPDHLNVWRKDGDDIVREDMPTGKERRVIHALSRKIS